MKKSHTAGKTAPHQVRIIGGQWKRTPLRVMEAEGLRPTPDRVRETVFNWLSHLLESEWSRIACLDLFAGTGALGFEAASRGAAKVTMVESNSAAVKQILANAEKLNASQIHVMRGDALTVSTSLASQGKERFDLIFADPPYHQEWLMKILPVCERLLKSGGLLYAEAEIPLDGHEAPDFMSDWDVLRSGKAGMVCFHLLRRKTQPQVEA